MKRKYLQKWMYMVMATSMLVSQVPASTFSMPTVLAEESTTPQTEGLLKAGSISVSDERVTQGQPLARGTDGSDIFRIPCIITLKNGDILTAADARYTEYRDFGGIDTIASVSSDGGKTWHYSYPIYFPDSKGSAQMGKTGGVAATTVIDPAIVQGPDDTIYCLADVNPTGVTTFDVWPGAGTGYITVDGKERLALTSSWANSATNPKDASATEATYEYYVGDFDEEGFAQVIKRSDGTASQYVVDAWYNIYTVNGDEKTPLTQKVVNDSTTDIQQNVFYKDSVLHVYKTGYIWIVESKDNGRTWENPRILNDSIKRENGERALLVSPGQGLTTSKGDILVGYYEAEGTEQAGFFYSNDKGKTWKRTKQEATTYKSSENEMVELEDGTIRMFFRNDHMKICYADATRDENGDYSFSSPVIMNIASSSNCNVTAIKLKNKKINDKPVILVGNPNTPGAWNRNEGRIHAFTENEDKSMTLINTFHINEGTYAYSCMTELSNGNIGLLWEPGINDDSEIRYDEFDIDKILGTNKSNDLVLDKGKEHEEIYVTEEAMTVGTQPDSEVATVNVETASTYTHSLFDRTGDANESEPRKSFSETANTAISLSNAEFEFQAQEGEDLYKIYNKSANTYLTNDTTANTYFGSAKDMKVVKVGEGAETKFRICKSDDTRYIMFHNPGMNFNGNSGGYNSSMSTGTQELVLLEKQDTVSDDDIIKGYKKATSITSGKKYLIAHILGDDIAVLYPTNGTNNQTKLVDTSVAPKVEISNTVKINPVGNGTTTAVIGGNKYNITVKTPVISSGLISASAGSQQSASGANSAAAAIDGDLNTHWQTHATNDKTSYDNHHITIDLGRNYQVDGLRYSTRWNGSKGSITKYKIYTSLDGKDFTEVPEDQGGTGEWDYINRAWYEADFTKREARYVRLQVVESRVGATDSFLSTAAEIQVRGVKSSGDADYSKVDEAIEAVPKDLTGYTKGSVRELQLLIDSVVRDYGADRQAEVDAIAQAIKDAIAALEVEGSITSAKIQGVTIEAVGTQNKTSGNESAEASLDGSNTTLWHSNYSNSTDTASYENHWITFDLGKNYMVNQLRYRSRPDGNNGNIKKYEIYLSTDGQEFTKIIEDSWEAAAATWFESDFRSREARYVKLKVLDATSDNANKFSSASEFEIMGYEKTENPGDGSDTTVEVTEVTISGTSNTMKVGDTMTLTATVTPEDATDKELTWSTSDEEIATVTNGEVTAVGAGEVVIKATAKNGVAGEYNITVEANDEGGSEGEGNDDVQQEIAAAKSALQEVMEEANAKVQTDYTEESWARFATALEEAKAEVEKEEATKESLEEAKATLESAMEALAPVQGEGGDDNEDQAQQEIAAAKEALDKVITSATGKKEADYTKESWSAYQVALKAANDLKASTTATKAELETAKANLEKAIAGLKPAPQTPSGGDSQGGSGNQSGTSGGQQQVQQQEVETAKKDLNNVMQEAGTKQESAYTKESFNVYQNAYKEAQSVFNNPNATKAEIDAVKLKLQKALQGLQAVTTQKPEEQKPAEVVKPGVTFKNGTYQFKITSATEAQFTGVATSIKTVKIANTIQYGGKTLKVTSIANNALKGDKVVTKVVLGSNIKNIGNSAFEGCTKLTSVNLKNVTKIGNKAFKKCTSLKKVTIPKKVTNLGKSVFEGCTKLSKITIKATALKRVGKNTFKSISAKAKIKVPKKNLAKYKKILKNKGQGKKVTIK